MEEYIRISNINDFLFCPMSMYWHGIYESFGASVYHHAPQTGGRILHEPVDNKTYSTRKNILQGIEVYNERYRIAGKIDLFDVESGTLTERKSRIERVYDGYKYQLYAQYFCLSDMGYAVKSLKLHSLSDNRNYRISLPDEKTTTEFESVLECLREFRVDKPFRQNERKCLKCIYAPLCHINHHAIAA